MALSLFIEQQILKKEKNILQDQKKKLKQKESHLKNNEYELLTRETHNLLEEHEINVDSFGYRSVMAFSNSDKNIEGKERCYPKETCV